MWSRESQTMTRNAVRWTLAALALAGAPVDAAPPGEALWSLDTGG